MSMPGSRVEVMKFLGNQLGPALEEYLKPVEDSWQPTDFLPDSRTENFRDEIRLLQESVRELSYDYWVVLVGDTITEEALPTYESWLMSMHTIDPTSTDGWTSWIRSWTAEENRHGDLLNKFLYLSGRINMRAMEISTQHLLADGFDIGTGRDPYRNFVYTSFQELATNISHRRTATLAKRAGCNQLSKICGVIASDEMRHHKAYSSFVSKIFEVDPSDMLLAFEDMMRKKIVMPAHFLRQQGERIGESWVHFSDVAQRIGVYTTHDYINIMEGLIKDWNIGALNNLNDAAERGRDYLMTLPERLRRLADRTTVPEDHYNFSWIAT